MAETGGDITCDVLENLDLFERSLLDYEEVLRAGQDDVSLVHIMFRYAHNSKGGFAILGREHCAQLVHAVEACFDKIRNGALQGSLGLVEQSLQAISALREVLETGGDPLEFEVRAACFSALCEGEQLQSPHVRDDRIPFQLSESELHILESASQSANFYLVDKSVRSSLSEELFNALPIFEDIQVIGSLVAQRPAFKEFPVDLPEVVVRLLFASEQSLEEVSGYIFDPVRQVKRPEPRLPAKQGGRARVLIAEDEFTSRQVLHHFLGAHCEVDVASNGVEAIEAFKAAAESGYPYDLVCLDIMMPRLNGQEVLRRVRSFEEAHNVHGLDGVKIIMATSLDDSANLFGAFRSGCEGYLVKPVDRSKLLTLLKKLGVCLEPMI